MFTGIVTAIGTVEQVSRKADTRAVIACPWDPAAIAIGASISCSGVCLTVVERSGAAGAAWFAVDISDETISCTVPGMWVEGQRLNLEPSVDISSPAMSMLSARSSAATRWAVPPAC
jgi:riboflavin synthase